MNGGEIFIPKLPSIKIIDLANSLDSKIEKKIIGIQPGEKLHETMFTKMDCPNIIEFKDYFIIVPNIKFFKKNKNFYVNKNDKRGKKTKELSTYSSKDNIFLNLKDLKKLFLVKKIILMIFNLKKKLQVLLIRKKVVNLNKNIFKKKLIQIKKFF